MVQINRVTAAPARYLRSPSDSEALYIFYDQWHPRGPASIEHSFSAQFGGPVMRPRHRAFPAPLPAPDVTPDRPPRPRAISRRWPANSRCMARGAKLDLLAYFLEMARIEAQTIRSRGRRSGARRPQPAGSLRRRSATRPPAWRSISPGRLQVEQGEVTLLRVQSRRAPDRPRDTGAAPSSASRGHRAGQLPAPGPARPSRPSPAARGGAAAALPRR